jgi:hypothetical protein
VPLVPVETRDFVDVAARARELSCQVPARLALLPGNFATAASAAELRYHKAAPEVRSAWRRIGLKDEGPGSDPWIRDSGENGDCTAAHPMGCSEGLSPFSRPRGEANIESANIPLIAFFGRELRSGPARLITYALGAVASVLSAHTGEAGAPETRFDAIVERPGFGGYACIECRGDACELVELAGTVREILMGSPSPGTDDDEGA